MADETEQRFRTLSRDHADVARALEVCEQRAGAADGDGMLNGRGAHLTYQDEQRRLALCQQDLAARTEEITALRAAHDVEVEVLIMGPVHHAMATCARAIDPRRRLYALMAWHVHHRT
jgi:hypothetical protein